VPPLCRASSDGQLMVPSAPAPSTAVGCCMSLLASAECWTTKLSAAAAAGLQPASMAARGSSAHERGTNGAPAWALASTRNIALIAVLVLV
jgi:hypothetical protein